jgi:Nuclear cap-binding protein subunit 3
VPAIYTEDPERESQPTKIHIRGIDDLSTDDVRKFASEHFSTPPVFVQWIDDSSANLVYSSSDIALESLAALCAVTPTKTDVITNPLQLRDAKPCPGCHLQVRRAVVGDKKKRNAKEASRYYLLHPEADPIERMRTEFANGRSRRNGDHGDYQRRRYNDREDRRRRDQDANGEPGGGFNASMYDDTPEPRPSRSHGRGRRGARNRSASPGRSVTNSDEIIIDDASTSENDRPSFQRNTRNRFRNRSPPPTYAIDDPHPFPRANRRKELFPSNTGTKSGQLASDHLQTQKHADRAAAAAKLKKELFPNRTDRSNHRRSDAFDARAAADAANSAELSSRMDRRMDLADGNSNIPSTTTTTITTTNANAGKELFSPTSSSTLTSATAMERGSTGGKGGLSIRGGAGLSIKGGAGMSIKGAATAAATDVRELFPDKFVRAGGNEGKELFSDKIKGRGSVRRNRAEDLFG